MKPVTRLFFITTGWTLAMYLASNFVGAWFWDIGAGIRPIILFYTMLFVVMVLSFALASRIQSRLAPSTLMAVGIGLNAVYLALLLLLKAQTRHYLVPLAILDGASSSFYWLSLFVLASSWVQPEQASWYNSWTGTIEAVLGLVAPPLSGWVIRMIPGLNGYRTVFFVAFLSLLGCTWLILSGRHPAIAEVQEKYPVLTEPVHEEIPEWRRLTWSFAALGVRDGIYFFIPNLLIYIVTRNTVLLGLFSAMQALIEGGVFWAITRWSSTLTHKVGLLAATLLSLLALGLLVVPMNAFVLFVLGAIIAMSYPSFKVVLESAALAKITTYGKTESARIQLTGRKEVWINGGRLSSLIFLLGLLSILGPFHLQDFQWILGLWALVPVAIFFTASGLQPLAA